MVVLAAAVPRSRSSERDSACTYLRRPLALSLPYPSSDCVVGLQHRLECGIVKSSFRNALCAIDVPSCDLRLKDQRDGCGGGKRVSSSTQLRRAEARHPGIGHKPGNQCGQHHANKIDDPPTPHARSKLVSKEAEATSRQQHGSQQLAAAQGRQKYSRTSA